MIYLAKGDFIMHSTYLFDFDGTLVDSMATFANTMFRILDENNISYPDDIIKIITPLGYAGTAKYFKDVLGLDMEIPDMLALMNEYALPDYRDSITLKEGVFDYLTMLKNNGCSLNILTASPHMVLDPCLKRNGVWDLFDNIWSSDDFSMKKSEERIYLAAAERLGKNVSEIAFFDDNIGAVKTAKNAGAYAVGVYDESGEDFKDELKAVAYAYVETFAKADMF